MTEATDQFYCQSSPVRETIRRAFDHRERSPLPSQAGVDGAYKLREAGEVIRLDTCGVAALRVAYDRGGGRALRARRYWEDSPLRWVLRDTALDFDVVTRNYDINIDAAMNFAGRVEIRSRYAPRATVVAQQLRSLPERLAFQVADRLIPAVESLYVSSVEARFRRDALVKELHEWFPAFTGSAEVAHAGLKDVRAATWNEGVECVVPLVRAVAEKFDRVVSIMTPELARHGLIKPDQARHGFYIRPILYGGVAEVLAP